jgi:acyl-CoA reductase-like NAD-dependent aldehyde dehydrogenase
MATTERLRSASMPSAVTAEESALGTFTALVGGRHVASGGKIAVLSPYDNSQVAVVHRARSREIEALYRYDDLTDAIERASASKFGLQAGIFTRDLGVVEEAFERIETGGLMVNDVSTFRVDHMQYGGLKHSGAGREGLRYAIEEMTELKLLTFNSAPL